MDKSSSQSSVVDDENFFSCIVLLANASSWNFFLYLKINLNNYKVVLDFKKNQIKKLSYAMNSLFK